MNDLGEARLQAATDYQVSLVSVLGEQAAAQTNIIQQTSNRILKDAALIADG